MTALTTSDRRAGHPVALLVALLVLVTGCGGDEDDVEATGGIGDEITEAPSPEPEPEPEPDPAGTGQQEQPQPEPEDDGPIALELPGLPIGGADVVFDAPSAQCALVNISGEPLPAGPVVAVRIFLVPPQFAVGAGACGGAPPCLGGHPLSADTGSCSVTVVWSGEPLPGGTTLAELAVARATLSCPDPAVCQQAITVLEASGLETIDLVVPEPTGTAEEGDSQHDEQPDEGDPSQDGEQPDEGDPSQDGERPEDGAGEAPE